MSRGSDAKKARRRKRQSARDVAWLPAPAFDQMLTDEDRLDGVDEALAAIDEWITGRGWVLDTDNAGDQLVSWVYPPSAAQFDDSRLEPVTRIWITLLEEPDKVVLECGALLVGFGADDEPYVLDPDSMAEDIVAVESYRPGLTRPALS